MSSRGKAIAVAGTCAAIGVVAGIAGASAAPGSRSSTTTTRPAATQPPIPGWRHRGGLRMGNGPAVHEDAVVLDRAGTGFITATEDNGTVASVSGDQLAVKEGIGKVSYKTVTLTIPAGATIERNFKPAKLTDLKAGDHVHVTQSSDGTVVFADDGTAGPPPGGPEGVGGPGGPPGPGGPSHRGPHGGWPVPPPPPGSGSGSTTTTTTTTS